MPEFDYPPHLRYTPEHEWVAVGDDDPHVVTIGITAFAQDALGDIVFVQLPAPEETLSAGQACGEVESTKSVSELYAPLRGTVVARNELLDASPELVNSDPYGEGWMLRIRVEDTAPLDDLMDAAAYAASVG